MNKALKRRTFTRTLNKVKRRPIRKTLYEWYVDEAKKLNTGRILSEDQYKDLHKNDTKKLTPYQKYIIRATELNVGAIFTEGEYDATIKDNTKKGRNINEYILARWQFQEDHSDAEVDAAFQAAKLKNPGLTRDQFIRDRGWNTIDKAASDMYEEIKASDEYQRLEADIEKLENKGEDLDLLDKIRLRNLREQKAAKLHTISQQIYGSE